MKPKTLNTIQITATFIGMFIGFIGTIKSDYWYIWAVLFVANLIVYSILLDRRENIRKGWRV